MAATMLTDRRIKTLKAPGMYSDGHGLYLRVDTKGLKRWVQRIRVKGGSLRNLGLGSFPLVGLADAREMALANQRMARAGTDPLIQKQVTRKVIPTFASAARTVIDLRQATWTNKKHASQWANTLRTYAYPTIGSMPVDQITSGDVLAVLTPIWTTKSETATRVRQRIETILDWAIAQGHRVDNPAGKALNRALPKMPRVKAHYRALPYEDVPAALEEVRNSSAQPATRLAFEYLVLTAARSGEVRIAQWSEIDWTSKTWNVPASRMKARRDHRVPLSDSALSVLLAAQRLEAKDTEDTGLIFPGLRGRPLSDMVHTALLRRLGIPAVPHGFRSSFKDWCIECTDTPWAVGEAALAHTLGNSTETAYARSDLFDRRRELMDAWAAYLTGY